MQSYELWLPCVILKTSAKILAQILQGCLSSKLRRKALRENSYQARVIELAHVHAAEMEQREIHALLSYNRNENDKWRTHSNNKRSSRKGTTNSSNGHSRYQQHDNHRVASKPQARGEYKKMAARPVTIVDTLQHTLLVQPEVRKVETAIRWTILLEYVTPSW